jgi:hypothetical protein
MIGDKEYRYELENDRIHIARVAAMFPYEYRLPIYSYCETVW